MVARTSWALIGLSAFAGAGMWARVHHLQADRAWARERGQSTPRSYRTDQYAGSSACRACHPTAYASWHGSYHRTMTQPASRETIAPAWDTTLADGTVLRWAGSRPEIVRPLPGGGTRTDAVVMTTGSHHMQLFWFPESPRVAGHPESGALRAFEYAWLIEAQRFVPNGATLLRPEGDDGVYTWNRVCIRCHAVAGNPGWREGSQTVDTKVVELGIACEACHGPARDHVEHHRSPVLRYLAHAQGVPMDIVQPAALAADAASQVCAQCHAITEFDDEPGWLAHGSTHDAADPIDRWGRLVRHPAKSDAAWIDEVLATDANFLVDRYWSDGMVRVTGREYNALVESPCHASGELSCLSCHSLHDGSRDDQLRVGMDGDAACTGCHAGNDYARPEHTHHDPSGEGARCMNCHMPRTAWGLLGAIRSHQVDSPDIATSEETGRPPACNLCHLDRSGSWTAAWLRRWQGEDVAIPELAASAAATGVLAAEAGVRALWAWHLGWAPATAVGGARWQLAVLAEALADPYPAVREVAWQSIVRGWPEAADGSTVVQQPGTTAGPDDAARIRAMAATAASDREGPVVLRRDGSPDRDEIARWRAGRDDRRIVLAE